jgi:hypothetical protein
MLTHHLSKVITASTFIAPFFVMPNDRISTPVASLSSSIEYDKGGVIIRKVAAVQTAYPKVSESGGRPPCPCPRETALGALSSRISQSPSMSFASSPSLPNSIATMAFSLARSDRKRASHLSLLRPNREPAEAPLLTQ